MTARQGRGAALAEQMLNVAEGLRSAPGCELYLINRSPEDGDVIWVTELWGSQKALDAALEELQSDSGKEQLSGVMDLLEGPPDRTDVQPLGGAGYLSGGTGATIVHLGEVEDQAPKFGFSHLGEARFAQRALDAARTGVAHFRLRPDARQAFGHKHDHAEEVYVVLAGSGRVRIDDEIHEITALDAIRVAPESMRAFEAGPDGLEFLAVGPHHPGDGDIAHDFWPA